MTADRLRVRQVPVAAVLPLRHEVLRPGRPKAESRYTADDEPTTVHLAVVDADDLVLACGTFFPERLDGEPAWRVRGMATRPAHRGRGLGTAIILAGIDHVVAHEGSLLWCNARVAALSLYRRVGFETVGELFDLPGIGAHYRAVLRLDPQAAQANATDS